MSDRWTLHVGDCTEVLQTLPDESIDAIVCDPPYGLSREPDIAEVLTHWLAGDDYEHRGGGFMGKSWDSFVPGPAVWRECLRVLKPGGHLVAFGGTRTFDLQTIALRMAGFEIRDCLSWLYGCLTDDTEVLTEHGWVNGLNVAEGDRIMQWDPTTGVLSLAPVAETFRAPWDGSMRVLRNADTDQILTPNHRVYHRTQQREQTKGVRRTWFDDEWAVSEAQDLTTCDPMKLPIAGRMHGEGIGGSDYAALLGWVWAEGGFDHSGSGVRIYQSSVNADKVAEIAALMDRCGVHKRYDRERTYRDRAYTESTWFFTGALAARVRADLPGKRPTYPLLWRMTMPEREAFLDAAMKGDGSGWPDGRGQQFYQKHEDDLIWFQTLLHTMDRAGKVGMRPNRPGGAVYLRNTATTELQHRHHKASSYEHYQCDVWCVRVPTGAFMARRNGRVFITGNSGFPKSANVSKAIDKAAGAEREVVGTKVYADGHVQNSTESIGYGVSDPAVDTRVTTAPATPEAAQWDGWGTALKPAWESIVWATKPGNGTTVDGILSVLEESLWSMWRASGAAAPSESSPPVSGVGVCDGARWNAELPISTWVASFDQMATSPSESQASTCWNIVRSWRLTLADLFAQRNTSIIETTIAPTIDWRTLNSLTSQITAESMLLALTQPSGSSSPVHGAAEMFAAVQAKLDVTQWLSATVTATALAPTSPLDGAEPLSPKWEPIVLARKPLQVDGRKATVAANVLAHGTGALNIDACRVGTEERTYGPGTPGANVQRLTGDDGRDAVRGRQYAEEYKRAPATTVTGRWPANIALGHSDGCVEVGTTVEGFVRGDEQVAVWACVPGCPVRMLDDQSGNRPGMAKGTLRRGATTGRSIGGESTYGTTDAFDVEAGYGDAGGASRFFYSSKASRKDRNRGLPDGVQSDHPTVKPTDLMRWLVKMVTPPNGVVLDPFAGSGTTGVAALDEGFRFVGIERDEHYANDLIRPRLEFADAGDQATKPASPPSSALESEPESDPEMGRPEAPTDWASSLFDGQPPEVTRDAGA